MAVDQAKKAVGTVERLLLPRLNSIDGELKSINTRMDSVNTRIDELDRRLTTKVEEMDSDTTFNLSRSEMKYEVYPKK
jgi:hypothetical protein